MTSWRKLRVMISSTVEDLARERQAVDDVIRTFEFERFRSESIGALNRAPRNVCEQMAHDCDLQIVVIGQRYGWIIPDLGISVTEREYDVARAADSGKVLLFVKDLPPGVREPRAEEFLCRATDFTTGLYRATPYQTTAQLAKQVKSAMSAWLSTRIIEGDVAPAVLFSLPTPSDARRQLGMLAALFGGLMLIPSLLRLVNVVPPSFTPSVWMIVFAWWKEPAVFITATTQTLLRAIVAWTFGMLGGFAAAVATAFLSRWLRILRTVGPAALAVSGVLAFLFGRFLGLDNFGVYAGSCVVAAIVAEQLLKHAAEITQAQNPDEASSLWMRRVFLPPGTALLLPMAIGIQFAAELLGARLGLGRLYSESMAYFRVEYSWSAGLLILMMPASAYVATRTLQGYLGWSLVVWPLLHDSPRRAPREEEPPPKSAITVGGGWSTIRALVFWILLASVGIAIWILSRKIGR